MKKFLKKIFGIEAIENEKQRAIQKKEDAQATEKLVLERIESALAAIDAQTQEAVRRKEDAETAEKVANEKAALAKAALEISKLSEKEAATAKKEPYIKVVQVHVNDQNIRNGFFELDWNEYFVLQLKADGYYGETDEDVVNLWFTEICRYAATESGIDPDRRQTGYIDVTKRADGKTEIS